MERLEWIEKNSAHQPAWLFISIFVLLSFYAWTLGHYRVLISQSVQASTNYRLANRMFEDNSLLQRQLDIILFVLYIVSGGLLLYLAESRFGLYPYGLKGYLLFLFNMALLTALLLLRAGVVAASGFLFNRSVLFRQYLYHSYIYNKLIGIAMLPWVLFLVYTDGWLREVFQWTAIALAGGILIMRMIRGFHFSLQREISLLYLILYLCALEIVPLVLLYRWMEGVL